MFVLHESSPSACLKPWMSGPDHLAILFAGASGKLWETHGRSSKRLLGSHFFHLDCALYRDLKLKDANCTKLSMHSITWYHLYDKQQQASEVSRTPPKETSTVSRLVRCNCFSRHLRCQVPRTCGKSMIRCLCWMYDINLSHKVSLISIRNSGMNMILASENDGFFVRCLPKHQAADIPRKTFTKFAHKVLQDLRAAKKAEASARQDWFRGRKCCLRVCRWCYSVNMAFFKDVKWLAWLYILLDMLYVPHVTIIILELWRVVEELFKFYGKDTPPFNDSFVSFFLLPGTWLSTCSFQNRNSLQII